MSTSLSRLALAAALAFTTGALAQSAQPASTAKTTKGEALVNAKGMTLYTFDQDTEGKSACNGQCATNWPPLIAPASAKASENWTIVKRDDGSQQWAYKGKPLYGWNKDSKPGDANGDGLLQGAWHVAKP